MFLRSTCTAPCDAQGVCRTSTSNGGALQVEDSLRVALRNCTFSNSMSQVFARMHECMRTQKVQMHAQYVHALGDLPHTFALPEAVSFVLLRRSSVLCLLRRIKEAPCRSCVRGQWNSRAAYSQTALRRCGRCLDAHSSARPSFGCNVRSGLSVGT